MSNLFVANGNVVLPRPFGPRWDFEDIYLESAQSVLDSDGRSCAESDFVDNWDEYHRRHGEVHCGTNARRVPVADEAQWWTQWKE